MKLRDKNTDIDNGKVIIEQLYKKIKENEDWIEQNPGATVEEFDEKTKEIEEICRILDKGIINEERKQANFEGEMPEEIPSNEEEKKDIA